MILTAKFARILQVHLSPLFEATEQIAQQTLGFEVGHSKIKEFEDVLHSFSDMKDNLKSSLEQHIHITDGNSFKVHRKLKRYADIYKRV